MRQRPSMSIVELEVNSTFRCHDNGRTPLAQRVMNWALRTDLVHPLAMSSRSRGRGCVALLDFWSYTAYVTRNNRGEETVNRRVPVLAALAAAWFVATVPTAASVDGMGPLPSADGALRLEMLSGPAQYVSGGAARVRVVVPASVPFGEARVELNGTDVTASFAADDQAPHALEGVLTGLP